MDDIQRKNDYEKSAHEASRWFDYGYFSSIAASILEKEYLSATREIKQKQSGKLPNELLMLSHIIYLKSIALELYLKSLYIYKGNRVTDGNGNFNYDSHNLVKLCQNVNFQLTKSQSTLLIKLNEAIKFWGRYPIPKHYRKWRQNTPLVVDGLPPVYSWDDSERQELDSILSNLRTELKGLLAI